MFPVDAQWESGPLKKHWKKREFDATAKPVAEHKPVTKTRDKI
jgi:hypothetical protein